MLLYFVRHAENPANIERVMSYRVVDFNLTERGVQQAEYVADWLTERQIKRLYSSPLKRAVQTAQIIDARLQVGDIPLIEDLRELNVGVLDGKGDPDSWKIHDDILRRWAQGEGQISFEGGEDYPTMQQRFITATQQIVTENAALGENEGIVIVTHGGLLVFGLPWLCDNLKDDNFLRHMQNTAVSVVEVKNAQYDCLTWGSVEHLPPDWRVK